MLYQAGIYKVLFFGDIDDEDTVKFLNDLEYTFYDEASKGIKNAPFFEISQLE